MLLLQAENNKIKTYVTSSHNTVTLNTKMSDVNDVLIRNCSTKLNKINKLESKESISNFAFDHMYACNTELVENVNQNSLLNSNSSEVCKTNENTERVATLSQLSDNLTCTKNEVRQLKELLLLHLDLIQQQNEQLINKDKLINTLKTENDTLKQRLGRMERRFSSKRNHASTPAQRTDKSPPPLNPITSPESLTFPALQTLLNENGCYDITNSNEIDSKDKIRLLEDFNHINSSTVSIAECIEQNKIFSKRDQSDQNQLNNINLIPEKKAYSYSTCPNKHINKHSEDLNHFNNSVGNTDSSSLKVKNLNSGFSSSVIGENDGKVINKIVLQKLHDQELNLHEDDDFNINNLSVEAEEIVSETFSNTKSEHSFNSSCNSSVPDADGVTIDEFQESANRKRALSSSSQTSGISQTVFGHLSFCDRGNNVKKSRKGSVLTTGDAYYTGVGETDFGIDDLELEPVSKTSLLEVPSWRRVVFEPINAKDTTGCEDSEFNACYKWHLKHEIEEKRRKRWDAQRIREQRTIERLKSRQNRSSIGISTKSSTAASPVRGSPLHTVPSLCTPASLFPSPTCATYVLLTNELPVCAFGSEMPQLQASEFSLPWFCSQLQSTSSNPTPSHRHSKASHGWRRQRH